MSSFNLPRFLPFLRSSGRVLWMELMALQWHGPRAALSLQTVGSVLLAVLLADALHMADRWWVAITAFVVMRSGWFASFSRAVQRMAGTIAGAVLALGLGRLTGQSPWIYALSLGLITGVGVYCAIGSSRSYAWLLATITTLLVLSESAVTATPLYWLCLQRVADVGVGIASCLAVAGVAYLLGRWRRRTEPAGSGAGASSAASGDAPQAHRLRLLRAWHALPGALIVGLLAAINFHYPFSNFPQMLVTIAVVLVIPLASLQRQEGDEHAVLLRMANRTLGCLLAAVVAFTLLPLVGDQPLLFLLCLSAGIWLASHVQSGNATTAYVGTQFGIAFLIVFVQDQAWSTDLGAAALRLVGILTGVIALAAAMLGVEQARRAGSQLRQRLRSGRG